MSSPKFEHIKQRHPGLSTLLDRLSAYIRAQTDSGQEYIVPKLAASALHISDGDAFILLELLAEGSVLRRVYNIYCRKENALLATMDSLETLDEFSHCDFCDCDHDPTDLKVEIAFTVPEGGLKDLAA